MEILETHKVRYHVFVSISSYYYCIISHWTLGDSDTQHDKTFLNDLIAAYKICTKEKNDSVTIDHLANKYLETHSKEEYRKNLKGIGLKTYLVQSNLFTVTEKIVTFTEGILYIY